MMKLIKTEKIVVSIAQDCMIDRNNIDCHWLNGIENHKKILLTIKCSYETLGIFNCFVLVLWLAKKKEDINDNEVGDE